MDQHNDTVPELNPLPSFRESPELAWLLAFLNDAGPEQWHLCALTYNWDYGVEPLQWIVEQSACDRGTAATIFHLARPEFDASKILAEPSYLDEEMLDYLRKAGAPIERRVLTADEGDIDERDMLAVDLERDELLKTIVAYWPTYGEQRFAPMEDALADLESVKLPFEIADDLRQPVLAGRVLNTVGWSEGFPPTYLFN